MNRRGLWLLLLALAACGKKEASPVGAAAAGGRPGLSDGAPAAPAAAFTVVAFGDSLTAGKDLPDPDAQAYPALLERRLRDKGYDVSIVNAGQSGDTTFDALNRLDYSLGEKPDVVLVALGANDTFQAKRLPDVEKNLEEIVRRAKAKGAVVLLCAMKTFPNLGPEYTAGFEAVFPRVARKERVMLVPFFLEGVAAEPSMLLPDRVHPNARGHERVAENLLPVVEAALKERKRR